jgi:hypothetical protein
LGIFLGENPCKVRLPQMSGAFLARIESCRDKMVAAKQILMASGIAVGKFGGFMAFTQKIWSMTEVKDFGGASLYLLATAYLEYVSKLNAWVAGDVTAAELILTDVFGIGLESTPET